MHRIFAKNEIFPIADWSQLAPKRKKIKKTTDAYNAKKSDGSKAADDENVYEFKSIFDSYKEDVK